MLHLDKIFMNYLSAVFTLLVLTSLTSCSLAEKEQPFVRGQKSLKIELKKKLLSGVNLHSGNGSQESPLKILVDEHVSAKKFFSLSDIFSNVTEAEEYASKLGEASLHPLSGMILPSLHSKLPLKLHGGGDEKYVELYFQGGTRLAKALQVGDAVLQSQSGGQIIEDFEEIYVTIYRQATGEAGSVALKALFNKDDISFFDIKAFQMDDVLVADRSVSSFQDILDQSTALDFSSYVLKGKQTILLQFETKKNVDPLLYPARTQILKTSPSSLAISSLSFKRSMWSDGENSKAQAEHPEEARLIKSAWNKPLDLSAYLEIRKEEVLKAKLYSINNLKIISAAGVAVLPNQQLNLKAVFNSDRGYTFDVINKPASFVVELSGSDRNLIEKRLYIKVLLTSPTSPLAKVAIDPHILSPVLTAGVLADGSQSRAYEFDVKTEKIQPSELVEHEVGNLIFTIRNLDHPSDFVKLGAKTSLGVHPGSLQDGNIPAGSWLLRISDSGSIKYKGKSLYFKLNFPKQPSSLEILSAKLSRNNSTIDEAVEVTIAAGNKLVLSHLTTAIGRALIYKVAKVGSSLTQKGAIESGVLRVGSEIGQETLKAGSFVLSVSDPGNQYTLGKTIFFKLTFEGDA